MQIYNVKTNTVKQNINKNKEYINSDLHSYPSNYYLNSPSFGSKLPNKKLIEKIGRENFPSPVIADKLELETDKSLYEVHKEYYKNLEDCKTLDEAKEKYPEFKFVKDAKEINTGLLGKRSIFRSIKNGKIEGITLDNLTLELLKRYFSQIKSIRNPENYFNASKDTITKMFEALNIPKPNKLYNEFLACSNPDYVSNARNQMKEIWKNDDGTLRERQSKIAKNVFSKPEVKEKRIESCRQDGYREKRRQIALKNWANNNGTWSENQRQRAMEIFNRPDVQEKRLAAVKSDEYRSKKSEITRTIWANDNGSLRENARQNLLERWQTDDGTMRNQARISAKSIWDNDDGTLRELARQRMLNLWANDDGTLRETVRNNAKKYLHTPELTAKNSERFKSEEYRNAYSLAFQRHPEITQKMREIAKTIPNLGIAIANVKAGTANEYEKIIYMTYFKKCEEAMPGYHKIIGRELHNILQENSLNKTC